jgi:Flp pilus assembly protein CpaB
VKRSNRLLILLGLVIAISAALGAFALSGSSGGGGGGGGGDNTALATPASTSEPPVTLVCAKKAADIQVGTTITADLVEPCTKTLSERDNAGPGTFTNVSDVVGKIAGETISKGSIVVASKDFYTNGSVIAGKSLSNSIKSGMVAISMEVDQTNGVGTLVVPGDHVDVILTVYIDQMAITEPSTGNSAIVPQLEAGSRLTSKMIFRNCRILATLLPASLAAPTQAAAPAPVQSGPIATAEPSSDIVQFTNRAEFVILEVTPEEAEVVRWAQRAESQAQANYVDLGLALRSSADNGADLATVPGGAKDAQPGGITVAQLISVYGVLPPDPLSTLPSALGAKVKW